MKPLELLDRSLSTRTLPAAVLLTLVGAAWLAVPAPALAQQQEARRSAEETVANSEIFAPLELPGPNRYRAGDGSPGPDYWQQRVDYEIEVRLEPDERRVSGSEAITYTNDSPHSLRRLWLQLDQNLFDPDSEGARTTSPGARFSGAFEGGGYEISGVRVVRGGESSEPAYRVDGTTMRVTLSEPLAANGGSLELRLNFAYTVPENGADRTGWMETKEGPLFQIAQWYPRMFTYDDVHGWNVMPYLGQGEFYLEYGSFEVAITVPRDVIVAATGELQNPEEVLTLVQRQRLARARTSQEAVHVVAPEEVGDPSARPKGEGPLTWRFRADSVRDFSWAASRAFIWDAASWDDVLLMSLYPREGLGVQARARAAGERPSRGGPPGWEASTRYLRHSVQHYSEKWDEMYPYPVAVNVAGPVLGMEYPGILFCSVEARGPRLFGVTDHELGHAWFPMMVGNDERRWFWMDEGLNTFMNYYSTRAFYRDLAAMFTGMAANRIANQMQAPARQPIMTYSDRIREQSLGFAAYQLPGFALVLLRDYVLGPERFDPAFREFIDRWKYRHPGPADFFRTMEQVAGVDLDWFWRGWFHTTEVLDQAVTEVSASGDTTRIRLENQAGLVMPVELSVTYADSSTERRRIPVQAWHTSDRFVDVVVGKRVVSVTVDPDNQLPDVEREDNSWSAPKGEARKKR